MEQKIIHVQAKEWDEFVGYVGMGKASIIVRFLIQEYNKAHRPKTDDTPKPMFDQLEGSYLASLKDIQKKKEEESKNLLKDLIKKEFAVQKDGENEDNGTK
jgi:hypothetical protein